MLGVFLKTFKNHLPHVSIIVCTYNRVVYLKKCLDSLQKLNYPNCEIIVVNGPSTDETDEVLSDYCDIKVLKQPKLNGLSVARNIGIEASSGEIIAFIDDDAVADANWLTCLVEEYKDETIGGVGGLVYGSEMTHIQFDNGVIDKCAIPTAIRNNNVSSKKNEFPILMGTNCSFRKDVLLSLGGFDAYFKYYHDESDLCVRILKKGFKIIYSRHAFVVHDMAEGHNRKSPYDLNWSEIMKNVEYFIVKNFGNEILSYTSRPIKSLYRQIIYFATVYRNKEVTFKDLIKIYLKLLLGAFRGYKDGVLSKIKRKDSDTNSFRSNICENDKHDKHIKICFLSQDFSKNCNGGVCRYTYDLAYALAELGNKVHVITKSEKDYEYMYRDQGVFVHKIISEPLDFLKLSDDMNISKKNLAYSYSACLKLLDIIDEYGIQIVEAPLWDAEGIVFSLMNQIPLVIRLETPLFKVAEIQGWEITTDLKFSNWMEGESARRANKTIAISKDIERLIRKHHTISKEKIELCPLGIEVPDKSLLLKYPSKNDFNVLFVGRLEKRKGIETLFKAMPVVLRKNPDTQFYIIGKDTNLSPNGGSYKKYLLQNLDVKYHKNVKFGGYVNDDELKNYYKNCDIFVAPSLYESFGLIYLEAMAWGKPVIGCEVGGIPEIVENCQDGILIPPDDENALAEAIIKLLTDENLRVKMGTSGRKKVVHELSTRKMAEAAHKLFGDVVASYIKFGE